jgi:glutamate-1-semialdehyde 2,1-aminomutase
MSAGAGPEGGAGAAAPEGAGSLPQRDGDLPQRAERLFPGGSSRTTLFVAPQPPFAARGEGWRLTDVNGEELIDLHGNFTALVHGHAHPTVVAAAETALREGASFGLPTAAEVQLAERLAERIAWAPRWRFVGSGTEAVMAAVKAARAASGRFKVLRFERCYHGAWEALSPPGAAGVPASAYEEIVEVPYGEAEAFEQALERHAEELACVLLDLMPNRAGLRPAERPFAQLVREQTRRHGIALILDEVITFRMATGGMQTLYCIEADIVTLGKLIGGGLPIGALGGRPEWMDVFDPRREGAVAIAGTFSANPVSMRAGLATLDALDAPQIERIGALGARLREGLGRLGFDVTGAGSLAKLRCDDLPALWRALYGEGVLVGADGLMSICTAMDEQLVDRALDAFARVGAGSAGRGGALGTGRSLRRGGSAGR